MKEMRINKRKANAVPVANIVMSSITIKRTGKNTFKLTSEGFTLDDCDKGIKLHVGKTLTIDNLAVMTEGE